MNQITDPRELPLAIYNMFFHNQRLAYKGNEVKPLRVTLRSGLGTIKKTQVGDYIYLEQNPHTRSMTAAMAREGKKILWVIHAPTGKYVGKVIEGVVSRT